MPTFEFFDDPGGTTPVEPGLFRVKPGISRAVYFLSPDVGKKVEANSNPSIDPIIFSIEDTTPGTDLAVSNIKIAASEASLAGAAYGTSTISVGTSINGGVGSGIAIWIGNDSTEGVGVSIVCNELLEDVI